MRKYIYMVLLLTVAFSAAGQEDKRDVRKGNRDYKKGEFAESEINFRKGIVKDSLSVAANYDLASSLYRQNKAKEALDVLQKQTVKELAAASEYGADYFYNIGDAAIAVEDWQTAVDALEESLLRNPGDLNAKENYIYAKKKLEQQQQQQQNDQNQDQNQDGQNDQNKNDQNKNDQNKDDQNKDDQKDDKKNDQNQDNKDQNKDQSQQNQGQQPKITPQAAQQMLQAIQAKEKETQEKVKKEKAAALQSRQKERNW